MNSLDKYNAAAASGMLSDNSASEIASLEALKSQYEADVDYLTEVINSSNSKIAAWRTKKTTAGTKYKKTLSSYISAEQGKITATRAEIARVKDKISEVKSKISEISKYKSASYYINQGVKDSRNYYDDLLSVEKNNYGIWYSQNKDSASVQEVAQKKNESIDNQKKIQQNFVNDLNNAYEKMAEIYGENAAESVNLQEILKDEQLVLENLKNSYEDVSDAVKETLKDKKESNDLDAENAKLINNLWNLTEGKDAPDYKKRIQNIESLNLQLKEQGETVTDTAYAYKEMVKQYGINSEESKKFENQLLSECVAYEKLKTKIEELYDVEDYDRKEREDIVFGLNDYLKKNKEFLLSTGMSEEEIYELAREVTGYNTLFDYSLNKPKGEDLLSSQNIIGDILKGVLTDSFGALPESFFSGEIPDMSGLEDVFAEFDGIIQLLGGMSDFFDMLFSIKDMYAQEGNTYSSVYNFTASSDETIADQLYAIKKYDSMKKARGLL